MGKITLFVNTIIIIIALLGFTNFLLLELNVDFEGLTDNDALSKNTRIAFSSEEFNSEEGSVSDTVQNDPCDDDTEAPTISAPTNITVPTDTGSCFATGISLGTPTVSDNCATNSPTNDAPESYPLGETTVTWTVTDAAGNWATATQTIRIEDTEKPGISAPADVIANTDTGSCSATGVSLGIPTISDNCGTNDPSNDAPVSYPLGETIVTWSVIDNSGNLATATQRITVADSEDPIISAPADVVVNTDPGSCSSTGVSLGNPTISDNCGSNGPTNDAPVSYPLGETIVTWSVIDNSGNLATTTQRITVADREDPIISAPADVVVNTDPGSCSATGVSLGNPTTSDNCGTNGPTNDAPVSYPLGETTVTWSITDASGNLATATQRITVADNENPGISAPADIIASTDPGSCSSTGVSLGTPTTSDNCGTNSPTNDAPVSYPLGETIVTWSVTDTSGNLATATQRITVVDNELPVILTENNITASNDPGECEASVNIIAATATDNCGVGQPVGTRSDGMALDAAYPVGSPVTITWKVKDANGNSAVAVDQQITIVDNEAPVPPQLEEIIWGCEYTVIPPVATDNCDGQITATGNRDYVFSSTGSITWTFTDNTGNSTTVNQVITINPLQVTIAKQDILCNGFATGEAEAIITGGIAPFTYDWGELGNGSFKDGLSPGSYGVTVTDANGCIADAIFEITEPGTFLEITNIFINKGCYAQNEAQITIEATGGTGLLSYYLNEQSIPGGTTGNLAPGTYTARVSDENNCSLEKDIIITEPEELLITNIVATETNTFGSSTGTATVILEGGTPNYTFEWSDGQTTQVASGLTAGEYAVTVTDANGCTVTETVIVIDPLKVAMLPTSRCLSDEGGLRTSGFEVESVQGGIAPYEYQWDFGGETNGGSTVQDDNTAVGAGFHSVNYVSSGTYKVSLTVTDSDGNVFVEILDHYVGECFEACGKTDNLDFVDSFFLGKEDGTPLLATECETYTGKEYMYLKVEKNANAYNPSIEFIYTIYNQAGGLVSEERITGCIPMEGNGKIPEIFRIGEVPNWSCGNSLNLENFYLDWTNGTHFPCGDTRRNMCFSTNENNEIHFPLNGKAVITHIFCHGANAGTITVNPSGGVGLYSYELTNLQTGEKITQGTKLFENLTAGMYDLIITDDNDSFPLRNLEIRQPENPLDLVEIDQVPLVCYGGNGATATVQATGGTAPYTIVWDHISQTSTEDTGTATNLSAGTYTVRVVDNNGCEFTTEVTIAAPVKLISDAGPDQILGCGIDQVKLQAVFPEYFNPRSGVEEFGSWTLVNGPSGSIFTDVNDPETFFTIKTTGAYTLRWTVPCGSYDDVKITFKNCSTIDFDGQDDHIDFSNNYNLSGDFTLEAWIKQDANSSSGMKTIISKRYSSDLSAGGYDLIISNNTPLFRWSTNSVSATHAIGTDRWYHIAVSANPVRIFVDGIDVTAESGQQANLITNPSNFLIGAMQDSISSVIPVNFFHGWIEEVRIWNTRLTQEQLRFMMNQRLKLNSSPVKGIVLPATVETPDELAWSTLQGYYQLLGSEATNGITLDKASDKVDGRLKNILTTQSNTAPLPYISAKDGIWFSKDTWKRPLLWDPPNSIGINGDTINWNIAHIFHDIPSGNKDITLLGLLSESGILDMEGSNSSGGTGNGLLLTHYLKLDGVIDLNGESQLVQTNGSILDENSSGFLERDQQGTASSFNYNYWSSPVSLQGASNNSTYTVAGVMLDGTSTASPKGLSFENWHEYADGAYSNPRKISNYWIHKFRGTANVYSEWKHIGSTGVLNAGEGFTMKGTSGNAAIADRQNYVFKGKPNNGTLTLSIAQDQNYLLGNPYPSSIDIEEFILDNLKDVNGGRNTTNVFNGAVYFWDHFAGKTHILRDYIGGYATRNLIDGVPAISNDFRINANDAIGSKIPGQYIPVAQGFFINTVLDPDLSGNISVVGGEVIFRNSQRAFVKETNPEDSQFLRPENNEKTAKKSKDKPKIRLDFKSPMGYNRQILVGVDPNTTDDFNLGYDAPLNDSNEEDMFWLINGKKYVIQGVPDFDLDQVLPLGIKIGKKGAFYIKINELKNIAENVNLYIKDLEDDTYHDLREADFTRNFEPGNYHERFELVFQKEVDQENEETDEENEEENEEENPTEEEGNGEEEIPEGIEVIFDNDRDRLVIFNPSLEKITNVVLYDTSGKETISFENVPTQKEIELEVERPLSSAVYFVKIYTEQTVYSKKLIINW